MKSGTRSIPEDMGKKRERESKGGEGVVPGGDPASSMFTEVRAQVSLKLMPVSSKHTAPSRTTGTLDHGPSGVPLYRRVQFLSPLPSPTRNADRGELRSPPGVGAFGVHRGRDRRGGRSLK